MKQNATEGIILKRINFGEADRIITVITPDYGKLRLMAKGVRRVKSKLAGGIELFSISSITYIPGKRDISTLVSTRLVKHFGSIVGDVHRTMLGYELLKSLDKVTEDETSPEFFDLIETALQALNDHEISLELIEAWFNVRLLDLLGHSPNLQQDVNGQKLEQGKVYEFDFENMAFFEREGAKFNDKHIKILRLLSTHSPQQITRVSDINELARDCNVLVKTLIKTN